jgi:signal transduction histidine kinase/DNA-binding response OmpR family regulator
MSGERILVVEDESIVSLDIQVQLGRLGYTVAEAAVSGEEAVRKAAEAAPDLVLMDIRLKGEMDGIQAAEQIRERFNVPVIYLTAYSDNTTLQRAKVTEPSGYLLKPLEARELHTTIEMALYKHRAEQALRQSAERLKILHEIDQAILAAESSAEIAGAALNQIHTFVPFDGASVTLFDFETDEATIVAVQGGVDLRLSPGGRLPLEQVKALLAELEESRIRVVDDLPSQSGPSPAGQSLQVAGTRSLMNAALVVRGRVIGSLNFGANRSGAFSEGQVQIISEVANSLAVAIHDATMRGQLHASNLRLEETLAELKGAQQQIIQQERLRALGEMASGIAHDFNNALVPILGFCDLLLEFPDDLRNKEKATEYLELINIAAKDAAALVGRLREFYRHRQLKEVLSPVNLNQLVKAAVPLTQPKWKDQAQGRGITLQLETELAEVAWIAGNESELREVLTNLIFNAVDAMSEDGTITLRTCSDEQSVLLQVSETGVGMTEEVRERCLEPFFSTKGATGTGLGLSMVFGVIQRHNGTIDIESAPGKGTTFSIRLPIQTAISGPPKAERPGPEVVRPLHVLLVEDELKVSQAAAAYLMSDGHTVETAEDGQAGLEIFYKNHAAFDVVVTDRAMPQMNGDQLAAAIKQLVPEMPVIMLTGFGEMMTDMEEMPEGVDLIVNKPATLKAFREALAKVL